MGVKTFIDEYHWMMGLACGGDALFQWLTVRALLL
jgi:hypothetical protein